MHARTNTYNLAIINLLHCIHIHYTMCYVRLCNIKLYIAMYARS